MQVGPDAFEVDDRELHRVQDRLGGDPAYPTDVEIGDVDGVGALCDPVHAFVD
jgi:hypothetical protein